VGRVHEAEGGGASRVRRGVLLPNRRRRSNLVGTGRGAQLDAQFHAAKVYLVLSSPGKPRSVRVLLDGHASKVVTVRRQRLYTLVNLPRNGRHKLSLLFDPGVSGFAFTFG